MEGERRQAMWQDYVATNAGVIARMTGGITGRNVEMPSWIELAYPEKKTVDTRSPAQIKADIMKGLTGA